MASRVSTCRHLLLGAGVCASVVLGGCRSSDTDEACEAPEPAWVVQGEPNPPDLAEELPVPTLDTDADGRPDGVTATPHTIVLDRPAGDLVLRGTGLELLSWGALDGDGDDDLLLRDGGVVHAVPGSEGAGEHHVRDVGEEVPDDLTFVWPDDLDGTPGVDVVVPGRAAGTSAVWSGASVLRGEARDQEPVRLQGLPWAFAALRRGAPPETLLLVADPPAIRFAARPRAVLHLAGAPAPRVEQIVVFEGEDGGRRIGLRIDERFAAWPVPGPCR